MFRAVAASIAYAVPALVLSQALSAAPVPAQIAAGGESIALAPHRAVYDMRLDDARSGSGVASVKGRMVYDFSGSACEGYTLAMRLVTRVANRQGDTTVTDIRSNTWEQGDGRAYRFDTSQYSDDKLTESTVGVANRQGRDGPVEVELQSPREARSELQAGVLFPTQHSLTVLTAAMAGRDVVQAPVFDGSDGAEKVYETTTFIGNAVPPGADEELTALDGAGAAMAEERAWPIVIGYFDGKPGEDSTPAYELGFNLYANGVSSNLTIDYGDFVIRGALSALELRAPAEPCRR